MSFFEFVKIEHDKVKDDSDYFFLVERNEIYMHLLTKDYGGFDDNEKSKDKFFDLLFLNIVQKNNDNLERIGHIKMAKTYNKNDYYMSTFFSHCLFRSQNVGFINYRIEFNTKTNFIGLANEGLPT